MIEETFGALGRGGHARRTDRRGDPSRYRVAVKAPPQRSPQGTLHQQARWDERGWQDALAVSHRRFSRCKAAWRAVGGQRPVGRRCLASSARERISCGSAPFSLRLGARVEGFSYPAARLRVGFDPGAPRSSGPRAGYTLRRWAGRPRSLAANTGAIVSPRQGAFPPWLPARRCCPQIAGIGGLGHKRKRLATVCLLGSMSTGPIRAVGGASLSLLPGARARLLLSFPESRMALRVCFWGRTRPAGTPLPKRPTSTPAAKAGGRALAGPRLASAKAFFSAGVLRPPKPLRALLLSDRGDPSLPSPPWTDRRIRSPERRRSSIAPPA